MKKAIKTKWLKALRSGDYKQGQGELCNSEGEYCCLGVLEDLYIKEHPGSKLIKSHLKNGGLLHKKVETWAGFTNKEATDNDINVIYKKEDVTLSHLNDSQELSFKQIANIIEKQL